MPTSPTPPYQQQFIRLALKRLPHHITLHIAVRARSERFVNRLNIYAEKNFVVDKTFENLGFSESELDKYQNTAKEAHLWHGTGRYKHGNDETVDVLASILKSQSLLPVEDAYAIFSNGEVMESISLTRFRVIARSYADMFGRGFREENRYGDALMWTSYHYGLLYARLYGLHFPTLRKYYRTWHSLTHDENGHNTWGKKVNKKAEDVWDIFGLGSDVEGNYPIVLGLKNIHDTITLAKDFSKYEVRVGRQISLSEINHIEVPLAEVENVRAMLAGHNVQISVFPIELGELAASKQRFGDLLGVQVS